MIKVNRNDYILVNYTAKKPMLALVIDPNHHKADLEVDGDENSDTMITYEPEKVVANLGPNPKHGSAFGVEIAPYVNSLTSKNFGKIDIYRKLDEKEIKALKRAMKNVFPKLQEHRCDISLPIRFKIKPAKGKYAGYFKMITRKKDNHVMDYICLQPQVMTDPLYLEYVIAHEVAHSLWFRAVPDNLKAKWVKLYRKRLVLIDVKNKELEALGNEIMSYEGSIKDYMKEMAEEDTNEIIKEVLSWIKKRHRMSGRDLRLLQDHASDVIMELWPSHAELTKGKNDPTEYAMKNVEEFFAESVALQVTGKRLAKDIQKALSVTLKKMMYVVDVKGLYEDEDD